LVSAERGRPLQKTGLKNWGGGGGTEYASREEEGSTFHASVSSQQRREKDKQTLVAPRLVGASRGGTGPEPD